MIYGAMAALVSGVDLVLKNWIEGQDQEKFPRPLDGCKGKIWLYRNHNAGFPFGFLQEREELVRTLPLVVTSMLGGILCWLECRKEKPCYRLGLALVIGGSLSNLYDRYVRKYVVDYFSLQFGVLKKVVFNLGDLFVFAGSAMLMILSLTEGASKKDGKKQMVDRNAEIL